MNLCIMLCTLDAQSCFDTVDLLQMGTFVSDRSTAIQVIVPRSNFSCDGRITGYQISLTSVIKDSGNYPIVQV